MNIRTFIDSQFSNHEFYYFLLRITGCYTPNLIKSPLLMDHIKPDMKAKGIYSNKLNKTPNVSKARKEENRIK